jgi:dTDP-4-amino-4,6-dideoxygalactose transaminase
MYLQRPGFALVTIRGDLHMPLDFDRRRLFQAAGTSSLLACLAHSAQAAADPQNQTLSLTEGKSQVPWPVWDDREARALLDVLNSGQWGRLGDGQFVAQFEASFAQASRVGYCVATSSGTTALLTAIGACDIGPGDEVILPPYTFVATFNAITHNYALPVFVDSDRQTFQLDATKLASQITDQTKLIVPVHIGGSMADVEAIGRLAKAKEIPMLEDACQAPLAHWRGQPSGAHGLASCISFQASKNLSAGEGGAVLTNEQDFADRCYQFHTPGSGRSTPSTGRGSNFRLTEFQAAILSAQLARAEAHAAHRDRNANYLTELLLQIPGIHPARLVDGCTRSAWHLYMFRYDLNHFEQLPRSIFLAELNKSGVAASSGYSSLNRSAHVLALANNRHYQRIYGQKRMSDWMQRNVCPENDRLCNEAVWLTQDKLLGTRGDMDRIAASIAAIQKRAAEIPRT